MGVAASENGGCVNLASGDRSNAAYHQPRFVPTYLQVVDDIPKTASEKPVERLLLEQFDPRAANVYTEPRD